MRQKIRHQFKKDKFYKIKGLSNYNFEFLGEYGSPHNPVWVCVFVDAKKRKRKQINMKLEKERLKINELK